jgi:hypothetical protein
MGMNFSSQLCLALLSKLSNLLIHNEDFPDSSSNFCRILFRRGFPEAFHNQLLSADFQWNDLVPFQLSGSIKHFFTQTDDFRELFAAYTIHDVYDFLF